MWECINDYKFKVSHSDSENSRTGQSRSRKSYLDAIQKNTRPGPRRKKLSEGNVAHASAACPILEKTELLGAKWANIGIITAYNDMLSAHQPFARIS
jgi:phosphogluconate dehydratase